MLLAVAVLLGLLLGGHAELLSSRPGNVHTLILTDCQHYQDWQTIAAAYAWRDSGQPGSVTRVANCAPKDAAKYSKNMLEYVRTHIAPQFAWYADLKDWYAAYNKPGAVVDWLKHFNPKEEWVVVLDSDMLLRRHFVPEELPLTRGWALAAHYDYLKGVNNDLALRHVKDIPPRNDTLAGPMGRRGDRVGGPYYMHMEDLKKVAPLWLSTTYEMRNDTEAWKDSGDTAAKEGDRIWIAEMYGYSFGAARANVWHKFQPDFMLYPGYTPDSMPRVIHYGLIYDVHHKQGTWQFDKHWYFDFDAHTCTPWDLKAEKPKSGIFPPPPHPSKLKHKDYLDYYKDLIATQAIALVNAGLCDYHVRYCNYTQQLKDVCEEVFALYDDIKYEIYDLEARWHCADHVAECKKWSDRGECKTSEQYMREHCAATCKFCTPAALPDHPYPAHRTITQGPDGRAVLSPRAQELPAGNGPAGAAAGGAAAAGATTTPAAAGAATTPAAAGAATTPAATTTAATPAAAATTAAAGAATIPAATTTTTPAAAATTGAAASGGGAAAAVHKEVKQLEEKDKAAAAAAAKQQQESHAAQKKEQELAADQAQHKQVAAQKQQQAAQAQLAVQTTAPTTAPDATKVQQPTTSSTSTTNATTTAAAAAAAGGVQAKVDAAAAATKPAAAAVGGAAAGGVAAAAGQPTEAALRAKYSASTLRYTELVKRCTQLQGLTDEQLKECILAASYQLLFPGALKPGAAAAASGATLLTDGATGTAAGGGAAVGAARLPSHLGGAHDLAGLGMLHLHGAKGVAGSEGSSSNSGRYLLIGALVLLGAAVGYYKSTHGRRMFPRKHQYRAE